MIRTTLTAILLAGGVANAAERIRFQRDEERLFVSGADIAVALNYEFKVVVAHRLVTFCRDGAGGLCIPVRLDDRNHRVKDDDVLIAAPVLNKTLRCRVSESDGRIVVKPGDNKTPPSESPDTHGYNADWGQGRGFRVGETLPDIPLIDLEGNEVRFSQFLGRRYIIYCWASW